MKTYQSVNNSVISDTTKTRNDQEQVHQYRGISIQMQGFGIWSNWQFYLVLVFYLIFIISGNIQ